MAKERNLTVIPKTEVVVTAAVLGELFLAGGEYGRKLSQYALRAIDVLSEAMESEETSDRITAAKAILQTTERAAILQHDTFRPGVTQLATALKPLGLSEGAIREGINDVLDQNPRRLHEVLARSSGSNDGGGVGEVH